MPGCDGWPLTTTGQPAASADAVSPPAVENASGKLLAPNTATGPIGTSIRRTSGRGIGLASGIGRVDDRLDVVAGVEHGGERLELPGGALELAAQASLRQPGLAPGHRDDLVAGGAQPGGRAAQQRGARVAVAQGGIVERALGGRDRGGDVGGGRLVEAGARPAGGGIDGVESRRHVLYGTGSVNEPVAIRPDRSSETRRPTTSSRSATS